MFNSSSLISHSRPHLSSLQGHKCTSVNSLHEVEPFFFFFFFFTKPVLNQPWNLFGAIVIKSVDFALTINHLQILFKVRLIRSRFSRHYQVKKLIYRRLYPDIIITLDKGFTIYLYICMKQRLQFSYKKIKFTRCLIKTRIFYGTKMPVHSFFIFTIYFPVSWSN